MDMTEEIKLSIESQMMRWDIWIKVQDGVCPDCLGGLSAYWCLYCLKRWEANAESVS